MRNAWGSWEEINVIWKRIRIARVIDVCFWKRCGLKIQRTERKHFFHESNVTGKYEAPGNRIIATISLAAVRVAKKNARDGTGCEFVFCRGGEVGIAKAAKNSEKPKIGCVTVKELIGVVRA